MKKSVNIEEEIKKMSENNYELIISGAQSDIPILNLNAVLFGAKFRLRSPEFISILEDRLINSDCTFFGMPLYNFVCAALDVLDVKKYEGNDDHIVRLIKADMNLV